MNKKETTLDVLKDIRNLLKSRLGIPENAQLQIPKVEPKITKTESGIITSTFPNILPVNTVEEGIREGHYNDHYRFINNKTVALKPAQGAKNLHLVCFNRTIGETEYVELLKKEGKQPCQNAPQYLLGLMRQVPEDKMPQELYNKHLVAAESSSVFADAGGSRCFLYVFRIGSDRELCLMIVDWDWGDDCAFLAEDLVS